MLALAGQPSLHGNDACMVFGLREHSEIAGKYNVRPLFSLFFVFLLSRNSLDVFGVFLFGIFGLGGQHTLGLLLICFLVLSFFFNFGCWLTHCDLALAAAVDFLAVVSIV